jgi:hypothetical protein
MAKVKNPLFSQEARGAVGGLIYNTWRGINYVKTNTSPTGQGTAKRLAAQAVLTTVAKLWGALTNERRAAWNQYAIDHPVTNWTGTPERLTGMNWFCKCAVANTLATETIVNDPPVAAAPAAITGLMISQNVLDLNIEWTTPSAAGKHVIVFLAGPLSKGVTAKLEQAKFEKRLDSDDGAPSALRVAATAGRYTAFAKVLDPATGLCSTWMSDLVDIT